MTQEKIRRDTRSNFGARGWGIILYAFINYYLYDSIANSALNAVVPGIAPTAASMSRRLQPSPPRRG